MSTSTPQQKSENSRRKANRGDGANRPRPPPVQTGGVVPPTGGAAGGLVGGFYQPPPLPVGLQRLIDGKTLASVRVEYTPSGAVTMAVPVGGEPIPLHEWKLARERQQKERAVSERHAQYCARITERKISGVSTPEKFASLAEVDKWLASLSKDARKLVEMTNKEFRALQGTKSAEASASVE